MKQKIRAALIVFTVAGLLAARAPQHAEGGSYAVRGSPKPDGLNEEILRKLVVGHWGGCNAATCEILLTDRGAE